MILLVVTWAVVIICPAICVVVSFYIVDEIEAHSQRRRDTLNCLERLPKVDEDK